MDIAELNTVLEENVFFLKNFPFIQQCLRLIICTKNYFYIY